uniref:Kazal-like domain-containing protein n=1 Tax=Hucho hucho TaxID=62062 RepID=A0A4W5M137_9TELE
MQLKLYNLINSTIISGSLFLSKYRAISMCVTHCLSLSVSVSLCLSPSLPPFLYVSLSLFLSHSVKPRKGSLAHKHWAGAGAHGKCRPCPVIHPSPVCGSDGHTYSSKCTLEFQECKSGKNIALKCGGPCPCLPDLELVKPHSHKTEKSGESLTSTLNLSVSLSVCQSVSKSVNQPVSQ